MKRVLGIIVVICFSMIFSVDFCKAQSFGLFGAISMPQGDFGDDSGADAGLAETGFGLGAEYSAPLGSPGWEWVMNGAVLLNGLDDDPFEDELGYIYGVEVDDVEVGSYINVPLMGGVRYRSPISPTADFFGMGLAGLNIVKGPTISFDMRIWDDYDWEYMNASAEQTFDMATSFGFGLGGGIILNKKFTIGFRYLNLGEPELKGELEVDVDYGGSGSAHVEFDQPVSVLLITAGVTF